MPMLRFQKIKTFISFNNKNIVIHCMSCEWEEIKLKKETIVFFANAVHSVPCDGAHGWTAAAPIRCP